MCYDYETRKGGQHERTLDTVEVLSLADGVGRIHAHIPHSLSLHSCSFLRMDHEHLLHTYIVQL